MSIKGWPTQEKDDRLTPQYATVEPVRVLQNGLSVLAHQFVREVGTDTAEASSTTTLINATGHAAQVGDIIRFTSGTLSGQEVKVYSVASNTITLAEELPSAPALGVSFQILRHKYPVVNASGELLTVSSFSEAATAADGGALPALTKVVSGYDGSTVQVLKTDSDGELQVDVLSSALPTGAATSSNQTSGSQKTQIVDASGGVITSTSIGPIKGLDVNVIKAAIDPGNDVFATTISGTRYNQIEVNFETAPGSTYITQTLSGGGAVSHTNGHALYSTSTATTAQAKAVSVGSVIYRPASESYAYFTAAFTAPTSANSYQRIGIYDSNNGFFLGYEGTSFGVTVRTGASDTSTARASFNGDLLTGASGSKFTRNGSPEAINLAYSNLFRIRFGWLGSASILFDVFSPDGVWVNFHTIKQPNSSLNPSIADPNLPITLDVKKTSADATNLIMATACWAGGTTSSYTKITDTLTDNSLASLNRSVITGVTTGGGGGYVNCKVNPSGALVVAATLSDIDSALDGQRPMATSLPVVIASDQSAVPASQSGVWNITNISGSISLPTNAASETTLSGLNGKFGSLGQKAMSGSAPVVIASDQSNLNISQVGRSVRNRARIDYTSTSVTTGAYVQLLASTSGAVNEVEIFDSSGQTLVLATGGAGSESDQIYIFPGGNGRVPLAIATSTRVAIKAVSATASVGEISVNFYA
jgi:hypothetical protein